MMHVILPRAPWGVFHFKSNPQNGCASETSLAISERWLTDAYADVERLDAGLLCAMEWRTAGNAKRVNASVLKKAVAVACAMERMMESIGRRVYVHALGRDAAVVCVMAWATVCVAKRINASVLKKAVAVHCVMERMMEYIG